MALKVSQRIGVLAGVGILGVAVATGAGILAISDLGTSAELLAEAPAVIEQATLADMFHDATYGDVYRVIQRRRCCRSNRGRFPSARGPRPPRGRAPHGPRQRVSESVTAAATSVEGEVAAYRSAAEGGDRRGRVRRRRDHRGDGLRRRVRCARREPALGPGGDRRRGRQSRSTTFTRPRTPAATWPSPSRSPY
ncbi:MAG: hypothetical protein R2705_11220 [Ilumatobacteraceae bacterium]